MRRNPSTSIPVRAISRLVSLVVVALAAAACDPPEPGEPPDPGPGAPEPSSPGDEADPSTRTIIHLSETESRAIVRGHLVGDYVSREALDEAKQCILRNRVDPESVRVVHARHVDDYPRLGPLTTVNAHPLLNGVPLTFTTIVFSCPRNGRPHHRSFDSKLPDIDTEPKISFVEAAIVAFPELRSGYSWLKPDDYTADLVVEDEDPSSIREEMVLKWVIGRKEMPAAERIHVDASTGAVLRGGPVLVGPSVWSTRCDLPLGVPVCPADAPPVCGIVDTGTRCFMGPCPSTKAVDFPNACAACASPWTISYYTRKCAPQDDVLY